MTLNVLAELRQLILSGSDGCGLTNRKQKEDDNSLNRIAEISLTNSTWVRPLRSVQPTPAR